MNAVFVRQEPLASTHDVRHKVVAMDLDERRRLLITVGRDRVVKVCATYCRVYKLFVCHTTPPHSLFHRGHEVHYRSHRLTVISRTAKLLVMPRLRV